MKFTKIKSLFVLVIILSIVLTGCGGNTTATTAVSSEAPKAEKTLVIAIPEEIEGTDVQQVRWDNLVHTLLYQPLAAFTLDTKNILAADAESYSMSDDGKEITFILPTDAKYSNGNPMTAENIKASMERYIEISPYSYDFDPIVEIIAKDEKTLILKLSDSAAYLWPVLTSSYGAPVDVTVANTVGVEAFNRDAVGNGLYMVKSWEQGSKIELVKNPNFKTFNTEVDNKGTALIDNLTIRFIPEDFTRVSELESGNVDMILGIPSQNVASLKANADITVYEYLQTGIDYLALNTNDVNLSNPNVRIAMALAVNKDELNNVLKNTVEPRYGLISESQIGFDQKTEDELKAQYSFNIEKSKEMLAAEGYADTNGDGILEKDGTSLSFTMMVALDAPSIKESAPLIQAQLKAVGINLDLREYESSYIKQKIKDNDFDIATRFFWWGDPDILSYVIHSDADLPWGDTAVDKMIEDGRYIMDLEARTAKYAEMQKATISQMPIIPLFSEYEYAAVRNNVTGVKVGADGKRMLMNDVDIK